MFDGGQTWVFGLAGGRRVPELTVVNAGFVELFADKTERYRELTPG